MMDVEVYDLECLSNLFTYTGYVKRTREWFQYTICRWRNEAKELFKHLIRGNFIQCGFNNLAYDNPLLEHFIRHYEAGDYEKLNGQEIAQLLYVKSQYLIEQKFTELKKPLIPQIDLYKIWHYNNKARSTSWTMVCFSEV